MGWAPEADWIDSAMADMATMPLADSAEPTEGGLWTPLEMEDYVRNLIHGYKSMMRDMRACRASFTDAEWSAWIDQYNAFAQWVKDLIKWDLLWGGTAVTAERYAGDLQKWRRKYREKCGREPSAPSIDPDPKGGSGSSKITTWVTLGVVGLGIYFGIKLVDLIGD